MASLAYGLSRGRGQLAAAAVRIPRSRATYLAYHSRVLAPLS